MQTAARTTDAKEDLVRWAAMGGVVGPLLFTSLVFLAAFLYDGYSHVTQKVSELGGEGARYALVQNVNFVLLGVFVIGFAWSLHRRFGHRWPGPALIGMFGLSSCIANGLLPCDVACRGQTTIALLHNITGTVGFLAALAGMLLLARRWRHDARWRSHARLTRAAASVGAAGLAWFIATQASDAQGLAGVAQRTFIAAVLGWMAVTAVRLVRERPDPGGAGSTVPASEG